MSVSISHSPSHQDFPLKILALGGLGQIGMNLTIMQYQSDLIIIDTGIMFPEHNLLGFDFIIPDFDFIRAHQENILGLVVTHAHEDHIGAIPALLKTFPHLPIFTNAFTARFIKQKLIEYGLLEGTTLNLIQEKIPFQVGSFQITPFPVSHSIPFTSKYSVIPLLLLRTSGLGQHSH